MRRNACWRGPAVIIGGAVASRIALSIIVPVWNEAAGIETALRRLAPQRASGAEVIVVDGGSSDGTVARAQPLADRVVESVRGRAAQMNAGAEHARGGALLFLHADTALPPAADELIVAALAEHHWGRFDVRLDGAHPVLPIVAALMNLRSRLTGIATGDQAIFMRRETFAVLGGFASLPLMEDVECCKRLKRIGVPANLRARVVTSGRRWEKFGVWRTILLMWRLRLAYFCGADPEALARLYQAQPKR
jgi:rSAM/selenodomain-associated transferase 2